MLSPKVASWIKHYYFGLFARYRIWVLVFPSMKLISTRIEKISLIHVLFECIILQIHYLAMWLRVSNWNWKSIRERAFPFTSYFIMTCKIRLGAHYEHSLMRFERVLKTHIFPITESTHQSMTYKSNSMKTGGAWGRRIGRIYLCLFLYFYL